MTKWVLLYNFLLHVSNDFFPSVANTDPKHLSCALLKLMDLMASSGSGKLCLKKRVSYPRCSNSNFTQS